MKTDRRELEDWEKAECAALKAAIATFNQAALPKERLTQEQIAQELGMTQGNLSSHLNGKRAITKEIAARIARLIGSPVESFSPRLAKEIAEMAAAVTHIKPTMASQQMAPNALLLDAEANEKPHSINMGALLKLKGRVTPRSLDVLKKIEKAAIEGRLKEADLIALEGIAARFEQLNTEKP